MDMTDSPKHGCLACGNHVGIFRRLVRRRFCSKEHEQIYFVRQQELAVERLRDALGLPPSANPSGAMPIEESKANAPNCSPFLAPQATGSGVA